MTTTSPKHRLLLAGAVIALTATSHLAMAQDARSAPRTSVAESPLRYLMNRGDTLVDIARKYLNNQADYRQVQRDNQIRDPRRIPTGRNIDIDTELLRTRADPPRLESYRGDVRVLRGERAIPLSVGTVLQEGDVLSTGSGAFARLSYSDGSHTVIPSNSRIRLDRLRRYEINDAPDHRISVEQGRTENRVTRRQRPGTFRVTTPNAISAVRGTEFRVSHDEASDISATGIIIGEVAFAGRNDEQGYLLGSGFGGITAGGDTDVQPVTLLTAPVMAEASALQTRRTLSFDFSAPENSRIVRGWIGDEAGMLDPVAEMEAATPVGKLTLQELPEGQWFLRLTAVSSEGIEGRARTFSFIRAVNVVDGLSLSQEILGKTRSYRFGWRAEGQGEATFRFQLFRSDENGNVQGPPVVDTPALTDSRYALTDLEPGTYSWRVEGVRHRFGQRLSVWSDSEILTISR